MNMRQVSLVILWSMIAFIMLSILNFATYEINQEIYVRSPDFKNTIAKWAEVFAVLLTALIAYQQLSGIRKGNQTSLLVEKTGSLNPKNLKQTGQISLGSSEKWNRLHYRNLKLV